MQCGDCFWGVFVILKANVDGGDCVVQLHPAIFLQLLDVHQHDACIVFIHATPERIDNRGIHFHNLGWSADGHSAENDVIARLHQHHLVQLASVGILSLKAHDPFAQINTGGIGACLNLRFGLIKR